MSHSTPSYIRASLLASVALLALPATAQAQSIASGPNAADVVDAPHNALDIVTLSSSAPPSLVDQLPQPTNAIPLTPASVLDTPHTYINPADVVDSPNITINDGYTPTQIYDTTNVTGVGQMITDSGGGSVGTCTGTLINARTVIFAAHCVNTRAQTAYGAGSGGVGIGVGFEQYTRPNAAGQPDELVQWLLPGPNQYKSNTTQHFYNGLQVYWNEASKAPASCTSATSCFLEADIAMMALDTPATGVPTWAMLFSPLDVPTSIDPVTGTGYHVTTVGYGSYGIGSSGAATSGNWRRRVAENMLGALTSLNARSTFLFGSPGTVSRPQAVYMLDFDDPNRTNPRDFNGLRDDALPKEGLTGPGDSGGPLILDKHFAKQVILGVLSGGSTFYTGQQGGSYGTHSFYQPLFLYWDWIAANNPYHYVTAKAGDSTWENAAQWLTETDPAYQIIQNGKLVNGTPTNTGAGLGSVPGFGEFCFGTDCEPVPANSAGSGATTGTDTSAPGVAAVTTDEVGREDVGTREGLDAGDAVDSPHAAIPGYSGTAAPSPTLGNGLAGATNFVPNNFDGVRTTGEKARFFNVTLRNAGNITLNSTVVIDRLAVAGASSKLTVATPASLTSLMDINQLTGMVQVDGRIASVGDYLLMSGLLSGSGRVTSPELTSVLGSIAPGAIGGIGTLTLAGNATLSSGSSLLIDVGPNGTSDRFAVVAGTLAGSGKANVGGTVQVSSIAGHTMRAGDIYTIVTAANGVTGTFKSTQLSAILKQNYIYNANSVQMRLDPGTYLGVVQGTPVQRGFAGLLDRNRAGNIAGIAGLYAFLDLQNAATIQNTLESWAPRTATLARSIGTVGVENMNRFYNTRLMSMDLDSGFDGSVAMIGKPIRLAHNQWSNIGAANTSMVASDAQEQMLPTKLADGTRGYIAGGYLDGDGRSMETAIPFGGKDDFDGWYVAAGIETEVGDASALGFGLSYTKLKGTTGGISQRVRGELFQGTLYGKTRSESNFVVDVQASAGLFSIKTLRAAVLGTTAYDLRSQDNTLALAAEIGLSKMFGSEAIEFGPRVALRASSVGFTKTVEKGGPMALLYNREDQESVQGLAGLTLGGNGKFRPYASAYYVRDFRNKPVAFGANFVGGIGRDAVFSLASQDKNWGELSLGLNFGGDNVQFSVGADTTIFRKDVSNQAYRGSVTFRF